MKRMDCLRPAIVGNERAAMRRGARPLLTAIWLLLCIMVSHAQPDRKTASAITHVSVFRNQAQVERKATITVEEGNHTLVFDGISPNLIANSIEVEASQGFSILSVSTRNDFLQHDQKPAQIVELEDTLEKIDEQLQSIGSDKKSIALQEELLLANKSVGGSAQGVKADELEDVLGIYQKNFHQFKVDLIRLNKEEKVLSNIRRKLQDQLNEYNQGLISLNNQLLINIKAERAISNAGIAIRYLVHGVTWQPFYDVRVKDTRSPVQFMLKANITQSTGESWKNVMLKLTTANPMQGGVRPVLETNYIRFVELQAVYGKSTRKRFEDEKAGSGSVDSTAADQLKLYYPAIAQKKMQVDFIEPEQNMVNTAFDVTVPYTIPSDGQQHQIDLSTFNLNATYNHVAVPRLDKDVFVTADVMANDLVNQLGGEANVYFEGTYVGKTQINPTSNDTLAITLGRDKRVIVERTRVKEMSSRSFFGSTRKESSTWEISIKNTNNDVLELDVEDQVPVSSNKEIAVKLLSYDGATYNAETGLLRWKLKLQAQESVKVRFSLEVSYPSGKQITSY